MTMRQAWSKPKKRENLGTDKKRNFPTHERLLQKGRKIYQQRAIISRNTEEIYLDSFSSCLSFLNSKANKELKWVSCRISSENLLRQGYTNICQTWCLQKWIPSWNKLKDFFMALFSFMVCWVRNHRRFHLRGSQSPQATPHWLHRAAVHLPQHSTDTPTPSQGSGQPWAVTAPDGGDSFPALGHQTLHLLPFKPCKWQSLTSWLQVWQQPRGQVVGRGAEQIFF